MQLTLRVLNPPPNHDSMESVLASGQALSIGLSHAHDPEDLRRLLGAAKVKPSFVQNPVFAVNRWDSEVRAVCREHGIVFQAYALNNVANDWVYQSGSVRRIAGRLNRTPQQVVVAFVKRLGLLPLVGPQDSVKMAHALTAARYLSSQLTEDDVAVLENVAFLPGETPTPSLEGADVRLSVANHLDSDVFLAWQHPDHSHLRTQHGMHAAPQRVSAGATASLDSKHRHGFYVWDAREGDVAPLYREEEEAGGKKWVRRLRADGFEGGGKGNEVVLDARFTVEVVNMGPSDREVLYVNSKGGGPEGGSPEVGSEDLISQGTAQGGGGSLRIWVYDGHTFAVQDSATGIGERVTVRRSDGDPQLLRVGDGSFVKGAASAGGEL